MSKLAKSHIELFPDELWLEVFAYNSPIDLYNAWRNLNSHINAILRSVCISIHIENKSDGNIHHKNALTYFPLQTVHIKDKRLDTRTTVQFWPIDLLPLVNIRSLQLALCSQEQLEQLINLHQLTRLILPCDNSSQDFLERFVLGRKGEELFPHLRSVGRIWCEKPKGSSSGDINTTIRHVHLYVLTCSSNIDFIQNLPELTSITVDYLGNEIAFPWSCLIWAKIRRQDDRKMNFSSQPTDQNKWLLLTMAPRVQSLQIEFNGNCDFARLAQLLERCSILERVLIKVKYYPNDLDLVPIRQLSRFFAGLTYGEIQKETGKPVIVVKWPS
jgi:hypothetical protein